jgi:hypothetical protein
MRCNGTRWPGRVWQWWRVTIIGPLGGFWSKLSRKRVTGWNYNMHVTFCTNYAVWEWVLKNQRSRVPENKQTNKHSCFVRSMQKIEGMGAICAENDLLLCRLDYNLVFPGRPSPLAGLGGLADDRPSKNIRRRQRPWNKFLFQSWHQLENRYIIAGAQKCMSLRNWEHIYAQQGHRSS